MQEPPDWLAPVAPLPPPAPLRPAPPRSVSSRALVTIVLLASVLSAVLGSAVTVALVQVAAPPASAPASVASATETGGPTAASAQASSVPTASSAATDSPPASSLESSASPAASASAAPSGATSGASPTSVSGASPVSGASGPDPNGVIVAVAAKVSPAVVTITTDVGGNQFDPFSVPSSGVGSGFVFASDGWVLTNNHVVEGASTLTVTFKGGRELPARLVTADASADLAVLKVDATGLATVAIGTSADLQVGQLLIAIGSPLGTFSDTVTSGILSATGRSITITDFQTRTRRTMTNLLQTDAAISPGNSGGPLLDATGRVIGINSAVVTTAEGIGFAIPIDAAKDIMDRARRSG